MEQLLGWERVLNSYVWGGPMIVLLMGTGLLLTLLTGVIQFRKLGFALREVLGKVFTRGQGRGSVTPFQAVATALASTVGVGNIAGVATAIFLGGPGALFWLWVSGLLGMCTKYAEIVVALHYREPDAAGTMRGGAMYTLPRRVRLPWLGAIFALLTSLAAFGIGNMVQANSVAASLNGRFGISPSLTGDRPDRPDGGGDPRRHQAHRRGHEVLVPFMALLYLGGGLIILIKYAGADPGGLRPGDRRGLHRDRGSRRVRRQHDHDGAALRHRPRPLLERGGSGQRADRARRGADGPSGAPGDVRHLRGVRRHGPDLHDDRDSSSSSRASGPRGSPARRSRRKRSKSACPARGATSWSPAASCCSPSPR
jgi:hypothetical protein